MGDGTDVCKIMHGEEKVDSENFFCLSQNTSTRGGVGGQAPMKLLGSSFKRHKKEELCDSSQTQPGELTCHKMR